mgnify:CR=1 FL=1
MGAYKDILVGIGEIAEKASYSIYSGELDKAEKQLVLALYMLFDLKDVRDEIEGGTED